MTIRYVQQLSAYQQLKLSSLLAFFASCQRYLMLVSDLVRFLYTAIDVNSIKNFV